MPNNEKQYFKCWKCGQTLTFTENGEVPRNMCVAPMLVRTSGICGGLINQPITEEEFNNIMHENLPLTLEKLKKEIKPYRDTLVLCDYKIMKLIDVEEEDDDYFWVFEDFNSINNNIDNQISTRKYSVLMRWTPLKGIINNEDYNDMVRVWNLNIERMKAK